MKLSIIVPVYYEEDNLRILYNDLKEKIFDVIDYDYELIMVDDCSGDNSYKIMKELATEDSNIKICRLSKNFGSHVAIMCGLSKATGDCAVWKGADMQEPSEIIPEMVKEWEKGNNVVIANRDNREEGFIQKTFANLYYFMVRNTSLPNMPKNGADIYLIDRKVVDVLLNLDEHNSSIVCQVLWSGFKTGSVHYVRKARERGKSGWTLKKKIKLTIDTLFGFSTFPIQLIKMAGILSLAGIAVWGLLALLFNDINMDSTSYIIMFNLGLFSVSMFAMSAIGGYVWRTFDASRNRPLYIIEEEGDESRPK